MSATETLPEASLAKKNGEMINKLAATVDTLVDKLSKTPAPGANPATALGVPWGARARKGEDVMTSRGFSFMKALGVLTGAVRPEDASVEMGVHQKLHDSLDKHYLTGARGMPGHVTGGRFLAPLATAFLGDDYVDRNTRAEFKSLVCAGSDGADMDEMAWIRKKQLQAAGYGAKALSWLQELNGGALVAPPEMGELIELLRNKEALVNAGARVVPLPPQGRLKYPRQTSPSSTYWVGENANITESLIGTGEVTLQAKKLAVLIKAPNELIRFASPAAEALLRDDMTKSLALGLDLAGLEGLGGDTRPLGIINNQFINRVNSSSPGANGDALVGQDAYRMIAAVEESNAEFEGWVMRPKTLYRYYQLRADAVAQGDSAGPYLFNLIREAGDGVAAMLGGYPVTKSTQVSQNQTKGSASNLTYIVGGMWSDFLIGMFGAIEFAATTLGDNSFSSDQTWIRGILSADCAARHQAAFALMSNLVVTG